MGQKIDSRRRQGGGTLQKWQRISLVRQPSSSVASFPSGDMLYDLLGPSQHQEEGGIRDLPLTGGEEDPDEAVGGWRNDDAFAELGVLDPLPGGSQSCVFTAHEILGWYSPIQTSALLSLKT